MLSLGLRPIFLQYLIWEVEPFSGKYQRKYSLVLWSSFERTSTLYTLTIQVSKGEIPQVANLVCNFVDVFQVLDS